MGRFNPASCQHLTHGHCAGSEQTSHSSFSSPRNNQGTSQSDQRVSIAAATLNSHLRYVHAPSVLEMEMQDAGAAKEAGEEKLEKNPLEKRDLG